MGRPTRKGSKARNLNTPPALKAISQISEAITQDLYIEDILKLIVTITAEVMNSKICSLMLLDSASNELRVRATQSISPLYNTKPNVKLGSGIAGLVAKENKSIVVLDVRKDPRYLNREIAVKENLCSLLSVPMNIKGKAIGVLNLYTSEPYDFSEEEVRILTTVASQSAIAIEHARLLVESEVIKDELKTRKAVERAKGILMRRDNLGEEAAFRKIQKMSMDTRRSMREIAEAIVLTSQLDQ